MARAVGLTLVWFASTITLKRCSGERAIFAR